MYKTHILCRTKFNAYNFASSGKIYSIQSVEICESTMQYSNHMRYFPLALYVIDVGSPIRLARLLEIGLVDGGTPTASGQGYFQGSARRPGSCALLQLCLPLFQRLPYLARNWVGYPLSSCLVDWFKTLRVLTAYRDLVTYMFVMLGPKEHIAFSICQLPCNLFKWFKHVYT